MANYSENFRGYSGHTPCPLCLSHLDSQAMCMTCPTIKENISVRGKYGDIFSNEVTRELVKSLQEIEKFRNEYLESRYVTMDEEQMPERATVHSDQEALVSLPGDAACYVL